MLDQVLARLATELDMMAGLLQDLQADFGQPGAAGTLDPHLMIRMQSLDLVQQTAEALSLFVGNIGEAVPGQPLDPAKFEDALRKIRLSAVSDRLRDHSPDEGEAESGDLDLF